MTITDTHCHITLNQTMEESIHTVKKALASNITKMICICTNFTEYEKAKRLKEVFPKNIFLAAATTPHDAFEKDSFLNILKKEAANHQLIAIGETGLDYHYYLETKNMQQKLLKDYIILANEYNLPLIIHCREAFADFFDIIGKNSLIKQSILHCFTGSYEEASEAVSLGFFLSFSGIITYPKSSALREVVAKIPLERILVETDAPYLAPQSKRGKKNEPSYIIETVTKIAQIKNISIEEIKKQLQINSEAAFRFQ